jgi:hypothetical protein
MLNGSKCVFFNPLLNNHAFWGGVYETRGNDLFCIVFGLSNRLDTGKRTFDYWKKKRFTPTLHPGIKNLRHWKKQNSRICTLNLFAAEISYLYNICRGWALKHAFCMIVKTFWS